MYQLITFPKKLRKLIIKFLKLLVLISKCCSRKASNKDVMHFLLVPSDPLISSIRLKKDKKNKELSEEARLLLKNVALNAE